MKNEIISKNIKKAEDFIKNNKNLKYKVKKYEILLKNDSDIFILHLPLNIDQNIQIKSYIVNLIKGKK